MSLMAKQEAARLEALRSYAILDTPRDDEFDGVAQLAARLLNAPVALISLLDQDRQWFKAAIGLEGLRETPRHMAFCDHAIRTPGVMVVPDATADPRFAGNPLVTGAPHIRFYAGAPLVMPDGQALGTLCVIDHEPRPGTTERDMAILAELSCFVRDKLELRRAMARSKALAAQTALIARMIVAAAEAPDFASAMIAAADAVAEATGGLFCHVWRLAADGQTALFVGGAGRGIFAGEACFAELRAMHLTPDVSSLAIALVREEQNWSENSAKSAASHNPAAALAWRGGATLQLATPFSVGAERYGFSLGLATAPPEREAMARLMREATAALRPLLRRHIDEAEARLFRRLIEISGAGILVSEPPFEEPGPRIIYANPAFQGMTGYSLEEIKGRSPRFLFGPGTDPEARRRIGAAIRTGQGAVEEVENYRKDGTSFWTSLRVTPVPDSNGVVTHYISSQTDITSMRDARLERDALTADLQRVIATMPGVLFRANKDSEGRWQRHYVSPSIEALTGFTVEEAMQPDWWLPNIDPADRAMLESSIEQSGVLLPFGQDFRFRHKQGHMIWIHRITNGYRDAEGRPEVISIWSDVTAEKRLLMDREELATDLQAVVEAMPGVLIRKRRGPDGAWYSVYVGPAIEGVTGHTVEEAMHRGWLEENLDPAEAKLLIGQLRDHFSMGQHSMEFRFRHKAGHWIWVRRIARGHMAAGGEPEVIAIWSDVSVEKSLSQRLAQSSKLAQLGEVATGMAHELNQPLAGISLAAENAQRVLARMAGAPQRVQEKLALIVHLTQRASDVIDHMRIFGRSEAAGRAAVSVAQAIAGAESLLTSKLQAGDVRLEVRLPDGLPPILGNSVPLEQVLMNLIGNACDAYASTPVPAGRRVIAITAHAEADWLTIEVQDAAGGIPEEILPRIFEPFFTTKPVGQGTGLGLSISYGIITDMGGRIMAENRAQGCLVRIMLPVAR